MAVSEMKICRVIKKRDIVIFLTWSMLATTLILAVSGIVCPRVLKFVNYDLSKHGVWQGKGYNATFDANDTTHDTSHGSLKTQIPLASELVASNTTGHLGGTGDYDAPTVFANDGDTAVDTLDDRNANVTAHLIASLVLAVVMLVICGGVLFKGRFNRASQEITNISKLEENLFYCQLANLILLFFSASLTHVLASGLTVYSVIQWTLAVFQFLLIYLAFQVWKNQTIEILMDPTVDADHGPGAKEICLLEQVNDTSPTAHYTATSCEEDVLYLDLI